jgi:hypothetical protein
LFVSCRGVHTGTNCVPDCFEFACACRHKPYKLVAAALLYSCHKPGL